MFSFHKPKIYRSNLGCCICKAKSSSSRFTDSQKYENEFERCFRIQEKRSGEICNACVLLVKRWKKLSPDNRLTKHWHHVVDARAGPGTKLTNIRGRITSSSSSSMSSTSSAAAARSSSASAGSNALSHHQPSGSGRQQKSTSDLLPLTSNQSANSSADNNTSQSASTSTGSGKGRSGSFNSNHHKGRALDTNVSTFTFGETTRRNYMALESNYFGGSNSVSMSKPQSALNSSAFELVIKRFRQRQQQQQIEATRRQQNRLQRLQRRKLQQSSEQQQQQQQVTTKRQLPIQQSETLTAAGETSSSGDDSGSMQKEKSFLSTTSDNSQQQQQQQQPAPMKRVKRLSESIGSLTVDGFRITNLLDAACWRKEKTCCGIIFRGLHNEVAIFPKLLRPCPKRKACSKPPAAGRPTTLRDISPPPRSTKSGSISSCDSNTSGTGSMDCPRVDLYAEQQASGASSKVRRRGFQQRKQSELRLAASELKSPTSKQQQKLDSPTCEETTSSSGASMSSHLMLMEDEMEEDGMVCELEIGEDFESSTDGSSESLSSTASDSLVAESGRNAKKSSSSVVGAAS